MATTRHWAFHSIARLRSALPWLIALAALLSPAFSRAAPQAYDIANDIALGNAKLASQLSTLRPGAQVRLSGVTLGEAIPETGTLVLEKFKLFSDDARVVVQGDGGEQSQPVPQVSFFRGSVEGIEGSRAFWMVDANNQMRGIITKNDEVFVNELDGAASSLQKAQKSRKIDWSVDFNGRTGFQCGVAEGFAKPVGVEQSNLRTAKGITLGQTVTAAAGTTNQKLATVIVDTDYELIQQLGGATSAQNYIAGLMAYVSSLYQAEINTRLEISQIIIRNTISDPWTETEADKLLGQLRAYWTQGANTSIDRTMVHLLSSKNIGGLAWVGSLCSPYNYGYGLSGNLSGGFNASNPQVVWDSVVVAHELGHNFGSNHTHTYDYTGGVTGALPVDCCYAEDPSGYCYSTLGRTGVGNLPGTGSLSGGVAGQGAGTLMSYCHQIYPYITNIAMTFGTSHTKGISPARVPALMTDRANTCLPDDPTYLPPSTLNVSKTGSGTVTSSPAGISCGATCSASYTNGTSVQLTANPQSGWTFTGWAGACSGLGSCTVSMSADQSVSATFQQGQNGGYAFSNLSGATGSELRYSIIVPSGAKNLLVQTKNGTGNVNLNTRYNTPPTTSTYDCASWTAGNNDSCFIPTPAAGTHHILLYGSTSYSGVTLEVSYFIQNGSCGYPQNLSLQNKTVTSTEQQVACSIIATGENYTISATGNLQLRAGDQIILNPGFSAVDGSRVSIGIDPAL